MTPPLLGTLPHERTPHLRRGEPPVRRAAVCYKAMLDRSA
jgi:hypothetical protein